MAAGAFLAGLILAEGEFSHQVHADVRPLRDLLASLFFISVGMLIDLREMCRCCRMVVARGGGHHGDQGRRCRRRARHDRLAAAGRPGVGARARAGGRVLVRPRPRGARRRRDQREVVAGAARRQRDHDGADADADRDCARVSPCG